jgi:high affinity sulfate transporter 1
MEKILRFFPGLKNLLGYRKEWFRHDLMAGVSVAAVAVPTAIAYAQIIGFEPVVGLYAAILPLLVYALFGSSRHLIVNPDAATCAMVAAALTPLAADHPENLVSLSVCLSILVGLFCFAGGVFKLGFVADFLSRPILVGFLNGVGIHIFLGQIGKVFGIPMKGHGLLASLREFIHLLPQTHVPTLIVGVLTILVILIGQRLLPRWPAPLLAVIFAVVIVFTLGLETKGVAVVGALPAGLPHLYLPKFDLGWVAPLFGDALAVALLSYSNAMVVARSFGAKNGYEVNADQEFMALGACQIAAGISQAFPVSGADSRTAINHAVGGKSQVAGLVAAAVMMIVLLFFTGPLSYLPKAALGAVLIVAAIGLFDLEEMKFFWRVSGKEFTVAMVTMLGVVAFGVLHGILVAVGLALLFLLIRASRPYDAVLGSVPDLKGFHNITHYDDAKTIPGLVLYRFSAAIIFFNTAYFKRRVHEVLMAYPETRWFIVDGGPINDIDSTGAEILKSLSEDLKRKGVRLGLADARTEVRSMLEKAGVLPHLDPEALFPTLKAAVKAWKDANP